MTPRPLERALWLAAITISLVALALFLSLPNDSLATDVVYGRF